MRAALKNPVDGTHGILCLVFQSAKVANKRAGSTIGPADLPAEVIDAGVDALWPHVDQISYGWRNGQVKPQVSRQALDLHFHAVWHGKFFGHRPNPNHIVDPLTKRDIAHAIAGESTRYIRSKWKGRILWTRFDVDTHNGQPDGPELMALFQTYFPPMYVCPSERGISGYIGLAIPTYQNDDGKTISPCSINEMNSLREEIHVAAVAVARNHGFSSTIEIHGSFLARNKAPRDENGIPTGPQTVAEGALGPRTQVKLPMFQNLEDVERFRAAVIHVNPRLSQYDAGLQRLFTDAKAIPPAPARTTSASIDRDKLEWAFDRLPNGFKEQAVEALGFVDDWRAFTIEQVQAVLNWKPASRKRCGPVSRVVLRDPGGDILKDTRSCIARAKQIHGYGHPAVLETAMTLYEENGMERDPGRDRKRIDRFKSADRFMERIHDPRKASTGTDANWYDDLLFLKERLTGAGAPAAIDAFNNSKLAKRRSIRLNLDYVADVANMLAKATTVHRDGSLNESHTVSNITIAKTMLKHCRSDDRSLIAAAKKIVLATCMEMEAPAVKATWEWVNGIRTYIVGRAARYRIVKWHWFPFLAQHAPAVPQPPKQAAPDPQIAKAAQDIIAKFQHGAGAISFLQQIKGDFSSSLAWFAAFLGFHGHEAQQKAAAIAQNQELAII